jgi:hypothetical protein
MYSYGFYVADDAINMYATAKIPMMASAVMISSSA